MTHPRRINGARIVEAHVINAALAEVRPLVLDRLYATFEAAHSLKPRRTVELVILHGTANMLGACLRVQRALTAREVLLFKQSALRAYEVATAVEEALECARRRPGFVTSRRLREEAAGLSEYIMSALEDLGWWPRV